MIIIRAAAVLVALALVLAVVYLFKRDARYLKWSWRVFVVALVCIVGVLGFYFVERVFL
jgi:hypothetical protein